MNARIKNKRARTLALQNNDIAVRTEAKIDILLEQSEEQNRRCAIIGGVAGGICGAAVSLTIAYVKILFGVR